MDAGETIVVSGVTINIHDLIGRAVKNARSRRGQKKTMRWVKVQDIFRHGSGVSAALCEMYELDPYELV